MVCIKFNSISQPKLTVFQLLRFVSHYIHNRLLTGCALGCVLVTTPAMAEYQPPADQKPPSSYTQSAGPRGGCEVHEEVGLTALAPQNHIGQTTSSHPTFAWFIPDSKSLPLEFALYKYTPIGDVQPIYKTRLKTAPGIMQLSLPKNYPGLVLGRYIWQVAMLCNPNHPSSDLVAKAEIERVEMLPTLAKQLTQTRDRVAKVKLYAQAGLWYDALAESLQETSLKSEVANLLENLARLESPETTDVSDRQSKYLRQIVRTQEMGSW